MNKYIYLFIIYIPLNISAQFTSQHIKLASQWTEENKENKQLYNDVVGWYDSINNKEYAIIGGIDSIFFLNITNPNKIEYIQAKAGRSKPCINRDFEIYKHYCYAIADEGSASLQIFDLQYLPDSVHTVYDNDSLSGNTHNIFRENNKLYLCKNRRQNTIYPLEILDITNPEIPTRIGTLKSPIVNNTKWFEYVHDIFVNNDTGYCSCGNNGLYIYNFNNPSNPKYISSFTQYPLSGYNHSSYLNTKNNTLYFTDENNGSGIKNIDFNNIKQPNLLSITQPAINAIPHNTYIKDNKLYVSCYHEGLKIYNIEVPKNPIEIGWFDTYPQNQNNNYQGFKGCWSVYPWLPSGIILASDTHNGLFVLKTDSNLGVEKNINFSKIHLYPNPAYNQLAINTDNKIIKVVYIYNTMGQLEETFENTNIIDTHSLLPGIYILKIIIEDKEYSEKFIKN